ncbi:nicotinamide-nucleotide amidohydrolase family protein [Corynebacterium sp. MSK297]|uniref:CinA family protein n=1 Tax=Corynebacterium sp. MSK297 TaxID=3050221 RepID=UPI00254E6CCB|nr:nicotinamide-nucleotide amidohydrolase family protein [Corynebacterium sp. MSK297]MDK8845064.1 nicotinamide-nucleotide amidohydrolase family protein [Corynebacterium sp. MSK297]
MPAFRSAYTGDCRDNACDDARDGDARAVLKLLESRSQTLATCESLTAGGLAARLADVPGASAVLQGGLVTYSAELKVLLAGVDRDLITRYGVISAECAQAMAGGARKACRSDWAVSLTGVAGPGPAEGHPAGDVYIAIAGPTSTSSSVQLHQWPNLTRGQVRENSVEAALRLLLSALSKA